MSSNGVSPADPTPAEQVAALEQDWAENPRWKDIERTYSAEDVVKLRPSIMSDVTLAKHGADRLWRQLAEMDYVHTFGAVTDGKATVNEAS